MVKKLKLSSARNETNIPEGVKIRGRQIT